MATAANDAREAGPEASGPLDPKRFDPTRAVGPGHQDPVDVTAMTGVKVFVADPRSPWQRGTNENTNGLLRQYLPRGQSFASVTQDDPDDAAALNTRPGKTHGYRTPIDLLEDSTALTG